MGNLVKEIRDKTFTVSLIEKGTNRMVNQDFVITHQLQLSTSEKALKEIFKGEIDRSMKKVSEIGFKELLLD